MQYVEFPKLGINVSRFGMGCMRFPKTKNEDGQEIIDEQEAIKMIKHAVDNGVNYFDTAYAYGGSEEVLGKALSGGLRKKVFIATKSPVYKIKEEGEFDSFFKEELERLQTDHIDFYLLHGLNKESWKKVKKLKLLNKLDTLKNYGKIKYASFSFHDNLETFKEIIDSYSWDMCQIQLNFMQEDFQAGVKGLKYAASKGIGVVIMEPLQGGLLAESIPEDIIKAWDSSGIRRTPAEWGFRWISDFPEATVILSGVSSMKQLKEDIGIFEKDLTGALTDKELKVYERIKGIYKENLKVKCTGCRYCMPCPSGVNIPTVFRFYNNTYLGNDTARWKKPYKSWLCANEADASQCSECGQCEEVCPQQIEIIEKLKDAHEHLTAD
jgi:predicted aldo/keto reductase-like oxidoreductase